MFPSIAQLLLFAAQGGNIGEGPGWNELFLLLWVAVSAVVGSVCASGVVLLRRMKPHRRGRPITGAVVAAYAFAVLTAPISGWVYLLYESFGLTVLTWAASVAIFVLGLGWCWRAPIALSVDDD